MALGVGRVLELLRDERVRRGLVQLLGLGDGALHAVLAGGEDQLRAVRGGELAALDAHRVRHRQDQVVALDRRDQRQADARVPARRLDQRPARLERAGRLRRLDHRQRDAVLDRPARIEILHLGDHFRRALVQVADADEGRVPDQFGNLFVDVRHVVFLLVFGVFTLVIQPLRL